MDHNNIEEMIQHYDYLMVIVDPFQLRIIFLKKMDKIIIIYCNCYAQKNQSVTTHLSKYRDVDRLTP